MEKGTILSWLVEDGGDFAAGDELVEIETDKAAMTHVAEAGGVLEIVATEGETVIVGGLIARIVEAGSSVSKAPDRLDAEAAGASAHGSVDQAESEQAEAIVEEPTSVTPDLSEGLLATPLARRVADAHEIAIASVAGTGPRGRVTKADVRAAIGPVSRVTRPASTAPTAGEKAATDPGIRSPADSDPAKGQTRVEELNRLQRVIVRRMAEAKATVPEFQVETEVEMNAAAEIRTSAKRIGDGRPVPSYNDMIVKAAAIALGDHPLANGSYRDGAFLLHERINVGIAVAADHGLVVPTIMDADGKSLGQIAADAKRLAERVRSGEITPPELSGATFTVSNLGMFGMTAITPVINLPQAAILGVGAMREVLKRNEAGEIVDVSMMTLTLTCDHRILYGADAARFLAEIKDLLEAPLHLLL
jgi:pyruvate dehydrogenase E2 component (dihydrolipoamide acetyltransferase)